jgi:hypothetical protein
MFSGKRKPESENTGENSPFVTVFVARTVVRKFFLSVVFLILAISLSLLVILTLVDLDPANAVDAEQFEMQKAQASFTGTILTFWAAIFLLLSIGFIISSFQNYQGSFKDLSDLMAHYRLSKKDALSSAVIACPKCGTEIRMTGEISNGECKFCGFEVYPKSANRKIAKASENFSALDLPELLNTGRELLAINNYVQAFHVFKNATVRFPENHEGWWGMLCAKTEMFGKVPVSSSSRSWYGKAYALAPPKTKDIYKNTFEAWSYARRAAQKQLEDN